MSFHQWDIVSVNLDPVVGSEQGKKRPCLIISADFMNERLNTIVVLPVTSRKEGRRIYPNEVLLQVELSGLPNESIVLVHQIRTIDRSGVGSIFGHIQDQNIKRDVFEAMDFHFGR